MQVISYGGGVQSTALLVLAARRAETDVVAIHVDLIDAEEPRTRRYVHEIARPYCESVGIRFISVEFDAIGDILKNPAHPKPPFRSETGGYPVRQCTQNWKIRPFRRALRALMKERGVRMTRGAVQVALGISYDELERMSQPNVAYYTHVYPLVDARLTRDDCLRIIEHEGLPAPVKSSCWFCPYARPERLSEIVSLYPDVGVMLDELRVRVSEARARKGLPLMVIGGALEGAPCSGYCME